MYGYIYLTTNLVNGKIYIGQHIAQEFEPNKYIGSGILLKKAIKKYGKDNFKNELLCECLSQSELDEKEIYFISKFDSQNPEIGYNLCAGGVDKTNRNLVSINNGIEEKHVPAEYLDAYLTDGFVVGRNMNTYINGMIGKSQSDKQKAAASKACSYKRTNEQKQNFSSAKKIPNKFVCLRTPDNNSTIRCLIQNKAYYLSLGYLECNNS